MKKFLLSVVAVATLTTGASASGFDELAKYPNLGEYTAIANDGGRCVKTKEHFSAEFNENFTSTSEAISFMGKIDGFTTCDAKVQGATVIIDCPRNQYYFFNTVQNCEIKLRQLKGGR